MTVRIVFEDEEAYDQAIREAQAKALQDAADEMWRIFTQERALLGMPTDEWLRNRATQIKEFGDVR